MSNDNIQGLTSCLKCNQVIGTDNALLLGLDRELSIAARRTAAMLGGMANHLAKKHPKLNGALEVSSMGYLGLLRLMQFRTSDPSVQRQRDQGRWHLLQQVLPCRMPDDKIAAQSRIFAAEILEIVENQTGSALQGWGGFSDAKAITQAKIAMKVRELMTGYRDAVEEPNKYPSEAPVVVDANG